jgi:hypothetical protein
MLTVVQEVRSPAVVDRDAGELWHNPDGFQGGLPPADIDVIVGEGLARPYSLLAQRPVLLPSCSYFTRFDTDWQVSVDQGGPDHHVAHVVRYKRPK